MRSCDGHGAASQGNDQGNWPNPTASLFTDPRSLPGRMAEVNTASPVLAFAASLPIGAQIGALAALKSAGFEPRPIANVRAALLNQLPFPAPRGRAGQPGSRAENRERGQSEARWILATAR
jgi:hypothetical protein